MFLSNTFEDGRRNLEVYFLTNNNKELNKALELYTYQYGDEELVSAFEYTDKKTGDKYIYILLKDTLEPNISYSYGFIELPLYIEDDGILRALFFFLGIIESYQKRFVSIIFKPTNAVNFQRKRD